MMPCFTARCWWNCSHALIFLAWQELAPLDNHEDVDSLEENSYMYSVPTAIDKITRRPCYEIMAVQKGAYTYLTRQCQWTDHDDGSNCPLTNFKGCEGALIADEVSNIFHNEHLSISIRWVDSNYGIHEDSLELIQLPHIKAQARFSVAKVHVIRCHWHHHSAEAQHFWWSQ